MLSGLHRTAIWDTVNQGMMLWRPMLGRRDSKLTHNMKSIMIRIHTLNTGLANQHLHIPYRRYQRDRPYEDPAFEYPKNRLRRRTRPRLPREQPQLQRALETLRLEGRDSPKILAQTFRETVFRRSRRTRRRKTLLTLACRDMVLRLRLNKIRTVRSQQRGKVRPDTTQQTILQRSSYSFPTMSLDR